MIEQTPEVLPYVDGPIAPKTRAMEESASLSLGTVVDVRT
jgi:hypothetical protein